VVAAGEDGVAALLSTQNAGNTWSETYRGLAVGALDTVACAPGATGAGPPTVAISSTPPMVGHRGRPPRTWTVVRT
jgi:hypothetical protein